MDIKVTPLDDRILVKQLEEEDEKVGSIYIPDSAKEKPQIGTVLAVGTDEELKKLLKKGDKIIYAKFGGTEIKLKGDEYIILKREDVLAKIG